MMMQQVGAFMNHQSLSQSPGEGVMAASVALEMYRREYKQGWLHSLWTMLIHRPHHLLNLDAVKARATVKNRRYGGIRTVQIDRIRGSENRSCDFDDQFHPLRSHNQRRWINVAVAMQQDQPIPPVELIQVGETYFVRDGHHRVSVARAMGQQAIEASVTTWSVN